MSTTHVYFADMPLAAAGPEGHTSLDVLNDDAIRQCRSISPNCNSSNSPIPRYERNMGFFRQLSRRFGLRSNDDLVFSNSNEDDTQSSSTDSCSSSATAAAISANIANAGDNNRKDNNQRCSSTANSEYISCASSETSSTVDIEEQLQQLQQQHQRQQQQHNLSNTDDSSDNIDVAEAETTEAEHNNENVDDVDKRSTYNKERKSFARSSFSRLHRRSTTSLRRAFEAFSLSSRSLSCSGATPPTNQPTSSSSSSSTTTTTNNGTPIKSALKSCSNLELNKHTSAAATSCLKKSSSSSQSAQCSAVKSTTTTSTTSSSSKSKSKPPPQRILRQPVSYTYLKGISGLPTQRVPRNSVCCQYARR